MSGKVKLVLWSAIGIAVVVVLVVSLHNMFTDDTVVEFKTEKLVRQDISSSISASGTVEPEELVNVGAQVSGKIMRFGNDADGRQIDYGSKVTEGMVLANIDEVLYDAALSEAKANKLQAEVSIMSANAELNLAEAELILAERNWDRAKVLNPKGAMARTDYDSAEANYITKKARVEVAKAGLEQAKAQLKIADASLVKAERNLSYCVIVSPVNGVIIDRRVSVGQTLVSSMSASTIFLIAKDLRKMQVWASVNEADIGQIHQGMKVRFTVDTFPEREFVGEVKKIRLNATMSQNVVTYVVEINTDNSDGTLLPYLTANVKFIREESLNTFCVSSAAVRYRPEEQMVDPKFRDIKLEKGTRLVWTKTDSGLRPIRVTTGVSSGSMIEVKSGELQEGMEIVLGHQQVVRDTAKKSDKSATRSPFATEMPKRVKNSSKR